MLTVLNGLLMSSATVIVRSGGLFWLKPVAMVFMLCSAVLCGDVWDVVCVERSDMRMYDVPMIMSLFGFGIGIMFASFHV